MKWAGHGVNIPTVQVRKLRLRNVKCHPEIRHVLHCAATREFETTLHISHEEQWKNIQRQDIVTESKITQYAF